MPVQQKPPDSRRRPLGHRERRDVDDRPPAPYRAPAARGGSCAASRRSAALERPAPQPSAALRCRSSQVRSRSVYRISGKRCLPSLFELDALAMKPTAALPTLVSIVLRPTVEAAGQGILQWRRRVRSACASTPWWRTSRHDRNSFEDPAREQPSHHRHSARRVVTAGAGRKASFGLTSSMPGRASRIGAGGSAAKSELRAPMPPRTLEQRLVSVRRAPFQRAAHYMARRSLGIAGPLSASSQRLWAPGRDARQARERPGPRRGGRRHDLQWRSAGPPGSPHTARSWPW